MGTGFIPTDVPIRSGRDFGPGGFVLLGLSASDMRCLLARFWALGSFLTHELKLKSRYFPGGFALPTLYVFVLVSDWLSQA